MTLTTMLDVIEALGAWSLPALWWPLTFWTAGALLALAALQLGGRSLPPLAHYRARQALLFALPLGLLAAAATDLSFLAAWLAPAAPSSSGATVQVLPLQPFSGAGRAPAASFTLLHVLGLATGGALLLAAWHLARLLTDAGALIQLHRSLNVQPPDGLAKRLIEAADLRRPVRLAWTARPIAPMTFGAARAVVVLPVVLRGDPEKLRLALAHELVHVRRCDALMQGLEQFVAALFFAHPLVAVLRRAVAARREQATDAAVLGASPADAHRYADLLYRFAQPAPPRSLRALAMAAPFTDLKSRIEAMKDHPETNRRFPHPQRLSLALGALLLTAAVGLAACADLAGPTTSDAPAPQAATPQSESTEGDEAFANASMTVDDMPELKGGLAALAKNVNYPELARKAGIEGRVIVAFVVSKEGRVEHPKVLNSPHEVLNAEALRVVKQATFTPGRQDDEAVPVRLSIPINFNLPAGENANASTSEKASLSSEAIESVEVDKRGEHPTIRIQTKPGTSEATKAKIRLEAERAQPGAQVTIQETDPNAADNGSAPPPPEATPSSKAIESVAVDKRGERPTIRIQTKPGTSEAEKEQIRQEAEKAQPGAQVTVE